MIASLVALSILSSPMELLCIGLDYKGSGEQELAGPADASLFSSTFQTHFHANSKVVLNPTKSQLVSSIKEAVNRAGANGKLVIYYSGHGDQIKDVNRTSGFRQALVPSDFNKGGKRSSDQLLDGPEIGKILQAGKDLAQITLVVDACHSSSITRGLLITKSLATEPVPSSQQKSLDLVGNLSNLTVFSACQPHQKAYQLNGGGVFTRSLLGALSDLRRVKAKGLIAWSDLLSETKARISWEISGAKLSENAQIPQLDGRLDQEAFGQSMLETDDMFPVVSTPRGLQVQAGLAMGLEKGFLIEVLGADKNLIGTFPIVSAAINVADLGPVNTEQKVGLTGRIIDRTPDNRLIVKVDLPAPSKSLVEAALVDVTKPKLFSLQGSSAEFVIKEEGQEWAIYGPDLAEPRAVCSKSPDKLRSLLVTLSRVRAIQKLQAPKQADVKIELRAVKLANEQIVAEAPALDLRSGDRFAIQVRATYGDGSVELNSNLWQRSKRYLYLYSIMPNGQISPLWRLASRSRFTTSDQEVSMTIPDGRWRWIGADGLLLCHDEKGQNAPLETALHSGTNYGVRLKGNVTGWVARFTYDGESFQYGSFETIKLFATSSPVDANLWLSPIVGRSSNSQRLFQILESFSDGVPVTRSTNVTDWAVAEVRLYPSK